VTGWGTVATPGYRRFSKLLTIHKSHLRRIAAFGVWSRQVDEESRTRYRGKLKLWSNITMTAIAIVAAARWLDYGLVNARIALAAHYPLIFILLATYMVLARKLLVASGGNVLGARVLKLLAYGTAACALAVFAISFFL